MIMFTIDIPANLVHTLNARGHWTKHRAKIKALRELGAIKWREQQQPMLPWASISLWIQYPDKRRRDVHNDMATVKPLIDGMVSAGMLPDDDHTHLDGPHLHFVTSEPCPKGLGRRYMFQVWEW